MRRKYLETYNLTDLEEYCSKKCINIVVKHHNENKENINYYRGLYAGYMYAKKLSRKIKKLHNFTITNIELYNHFKYTKNFKSNNNGMDAAFYDILNYISINLIFDFDKF